MKLKDNRIRLNGFLILFVVLFFVAVFFKLTYVGISTNVEGTNLKELEASRSTVTKTIRADRGNIYDNAGNLLAQNMNSYTVIAYLSKTRTTDDRYPKHVVDKEKTARELAGILEPLNSVMTYEYILGLLNQDLYQVELGPGGRNISEYVKEKIEKLTLPGISFTKTNKRYYQNGDFASYIIGYAKKYEDEKTGDSETIGELGIEGYCDQFLRGKDGTITYSKDAYGYQMANSVTYENPAEDGYDVYLTLDKQIQIFIDNAVNMISQKGASWITLTVADAKTGAIVGSSSSPSFNPNKLNITNYNNPMISYTYEPGSTMKIFSFMSAIEEGKYDGSANYNSGTITVGDYTIKDWNRYGWGTITYDVGFTYSSNTAAVKLAQAIGKDKLIDYYKNLGFGVETGIELANEYAGSLKNLTASTSEVELATSSYGQGVVVTPIQMIQALTSITNDGTTLKPYIIEKVVNPNNDKVVYQAKRKELNKVYSTKTVEKIKELMDLTVNGDDPARTGKPYHSDSVRIIGKTGTANYTDQYGKYLTGTYQNIRSFAGIFPKENPEYIVYLAVKDFQGSTSDLGYAVKQAVESISKYKNIDDRESDADTTKIVTVQNYTNKDTALVVENLKANKLNPIVVGDGTKIISQYPKNKTTISAGSKVFLITNGFNYTMPNVIGWSSTEFIDFCNLIGVEYNLNGYGYINAISIPAGTKIDSSVPIDATCSSIEPASLVTNREVKNEKEEE